MYCVSKSAWISCNDLSNPVNGRRPQENIKNFHFFLIKQKTNQPTFKEKIRSIRFENFSARKRG